MVRVEQYFGVGETDTDREETDHELSKDLVLFLDRKRSPWPSQGNEDEGSSMLKLDTRQRFVCLFSRENFFLALAKNIVFDLFKLDASLGFVCLFPKQTTIFLALAVYDIKS